MERRDQAFAARTYTIKATSKPRILASLTRYAIRLPKFLSVLGFSIGLAARSGPRDLGKAIGYFVEAVLLHAWATRNRIKHIHVHFANAAATVALIATKFGGLEYSLSVHGPDEFYDVKRNILREKIAASVFVRCIGYYCRSQIMRLSSMKHWSKIHIIRCGIYKDEFVRRPGRPGPARRILCVGRICPSKGQAMLVEAAERLRGKGLDFEIRLLGGGEDLEAIGSMVLARGLGDCVTVVGPVGHARVREELAACDLFVLPSFAEGIPVALMEAMASGIPVISTNIMGIPELIEHGVSGILTQPSNFEQLSDWIEAALLGRIDAASLTKKAAEKILAMYDAETNTKMLADVFLSALR